MNEIFGFVGVNQEKLIFKNDPLILGSWWWKACWGGRFRPQSALYSQKFIISMSKWVKMAFEAQKHYHS